MFLWNTTPKYSLKMLPFADFSLEHVQNMQKKMWLGKLKSMKSLQLPWVAEPPRSEMRKTLENSICYNAKTVSSVQIFARWCIFCVWTIEMKYQQIVAVCRRLWPLTLVNTRVHCNPVAHISPSISLNWKKAVWLYHFLRSLWKNFEFIAACGHWWCYTKTFLQS